MPPLAFVSVIAPKVMVVLAKEPTTYTFPLLSVTVLLELSAKAPEPALAQFQTGA